MARSKSHIERHASERIGWLRAAVLGANDGIISTASLIVGVAASHADRSAVLVAGTAGLIAGALKLLFGIARRADERQRATQDPTQGENS